MGDTSIAGARPPLFVCAISSFIAALEGRGSPPNTIAAYARDVRQLADFVGQSAPDASPRGLNLTLLRGWLRDLAARRVGPSSRARKVAAVRVFCGQLVRTGELTSNPALDLCLPKYVRPLPHVVSEIDAGAIVEGPTGEGPLALRDRALLELLYGVGLRVSELCALDLDDVRPAAMRIRGRWARTVPLGAAAAAALRRYAARRHELAAGRSHSLFVGRRGQRLGVRRVQAIVFRWGKQAGSSHRGGLHPHALRHSCATHMLDGGAELHHVAALLGARLQSVERYEDVAIGRLTAVHRAAHPLGRRHGAPASVLKAGLAGECSGERRSVSEPFVVASPEGRVSGGSPVARGDRLGDRGAGAGAPRRVAPAPGHSLSLIVRLEGNP
jgi:integrase/recombinase XerC